MRFRQVRTPNCNKCLKETLLGFMIHYNYLYIADDIQRAVNNVKRVGNNDLEEEDDDKDEKEELSDFDEGDGLGDEEKNKRKRDIWISNGLNESKSTTTGRNCGARRKGNHQRVRPRQLQAPTSKRSRSPK
eukprot:Nk52_evm1s233 gene=Nk52_evmTU1s233